MIIPCIDCITLSICKSITKEEAVMVPLLRNRCSLFDQFISDAIESTSDKLNKNNEKVENIIYQIQSFYGVYNIDKKRRIPVY